MVRIVRLEYLGVSEYLDKGLLPACDEYRLVPLRRAYGHLYDSIIDASRASQQRSDDLSDARCW